MLRRIVFAVIGLVVLGYAGVVGYMFLVQRDLQYVLAGEITPLARAGIAGAGAVTIPVGDGQAVNGWYAPPGEGRPVIVYYKGNSGSFSGEHERFARFVMDGYGFLAFDYRGFPASPGEISEAGVLEDALAAFDWAKALGERLVIWGRSLGSGPASYVASRREAEALLLETPFLSAVGVAAERYPYLPVGWVMLDSYRVDQWIADVAEPVLIAHGTADVVIGVSNGERLYALVPNPAGLWIVEGAGHSDLWARGIWEEARALFEGVGE